MASILSTGNVSFLPSFALKEGHRQSGVPCRSLGGDSSVVVLPDSVRANGGSSVKSKDRVAAPYGERNGGSGYDDRGMKTKDGSPGKFEPSWDDGYGTQTVIDYFEVAKDMVRPDGGPPRWFSPVSSGRPVKDKPVLLFLPGIDGLGVGLILHEKALGKVFEVRCLHIPVWDRTPFEDLVQLVEQTLRMEQALSPDKSLYLVGDSFGGCLALAVAARNPTMDLEVILANPATSFESSPLQPLFPLLEVLPEELYRTVPFLLSSTMGNPVKMATADIKSTDPWQFLQQLSENLTASLLCLPDMVNILPKETLTWKLKLLKSAAAYANSRLHTVTAEVLVLASGKDNLLPSKDEAQRLSRSIQNCRIHLFEDNGHSILLEGGVNLLTLIKSTSKYRQSLKHDFV